MCLREHTPNDKSWFTETSLDVNFFETRIPDTVWQQLNSVLFNGVLGDPCAAKNFVEVCRAIKQKNPAIKITVSTNGGLRSEKFWAELASVTDTVIFAIDGLADTNHIYRVNVNYAKVMRNSQAFINAGGNAHWQFISFAHNEHQIEAARSSASDLGFSQFFVKPSYRFILDEMTGTQHYGSTGIPLKPPVGNTVHKLIQFKPKKFNIAEWQASSNTSKIDCYAQHNKSAYIDHLGRLFPCCPLPSGMMVRRTVTTFKDGWDELWQAHGEDKINLHLNDWDTIVEGSFFQGVKDSWNKDYANGRLASCAGTCSNSELKFNHKEV